MNVEIVSNIEALRSLAPEWDALRRETSESTPFQSPHWLLPWWDAFGGGDLHVVTIREGGTLRALAPLYILRDDESGESLGLLLGTGNSDYLDALGNGNELLAELARADCQMWDLQQLPPSSSLLAGKAPSGWEDNVEDHESCPRLELENLTRSSHSEKKLRYARRSLERIGDLTFEDATVSSLDDLLTALFELHAARWQRRNLPGVLADDVVKRFHRQATRRMLDAGMLRMFAVRVGDRIPGVFYGFADSTTSYYYLSGYDPTLERYSLGNLMVDHAIEKASQDGIRTFDFLRGAENYKYAWGAKDRMNRRRILTRRRIQLSSLL